MRQSIETRFWSKVKILDNGCWLWLGKLNANGHGAFNMGSNDIQLAHRAAWQMMRMPRPSDGKLLQRSCETVGCVGPDHHHFYTTDERFWNFVRKTETCWEWTGDRVKGGYGRFSVGRKTASGHHLVLAHRFS